MITMKQLRFIFAPVLMAVLVSSELTIMPSGPLEWTEGKMLILTCASSSSDLANGLKWLDEDGTHIVTGPGKLIQPNPTDVSLVFTKLSMDDEGLYRCIREGGEDEEAAIQVNVKKEIKFLSPDEQSVINGTDARVWCRINLVIMSRTMKWYQRGPEGNFVSVGNLDGNRFIPGYESAAGQEGSYLLIRDANLGDSMSYTCSLEFRDRGTAKNFDIKVIVTVPPKIMPIYLDPTSPKEGEKLTMTCQADGVPPPTYMFYKGVKPLMEDRSQNGKYTIESLDRTDEGRYTCNAMNKGGSQNETLDLDVKIPPTFQNTQNESSMEGERVTMACTSEGDPVPSMFWRRQGSQVDYLSEAMSETDIYVERETDRVMQDGPSVLQRRTLNLVIPDLKPEHAGLYVCRADNQFGVKERTFKIDVLYKPNFDSQEVSLFYGWQGSTTNLTCIANGNPEPMFHWLFNGRELKAGDLDYDISMGNSGLPTRAIGYLKPKVSNINVDNIFGDYECKAFNKYGDNTQTLVFKRAVVPEMATVNVVSTKATEMGLRIYPPTQNGGQPVFVYVVKYGPSDSSLESLSRNFSRYPEEASTSLTLTNLTPKMAYSIRVYAVNNVGLGKEKKIVESTKDFSKPDPVTVLTPSEGVSGTSFELAWSVPMTGGRKISNYIVQYTEALKVDSSGDELKVVRESPDWKRKTVDGQSNTRTTLTGLKEETYYKVIITANNRMGSSKPTEFIFRTGRGVGPSGGTDCVRAGASVAGMLLVVVVTALLPPPPLL